MILKETDICINEDYFTDELLNSSKLQLSSYKRIAEKNKAHRELFHPFYARETRCMCNMFNRLLGVYKTPETWKINIIADEKDHSEKIIRGEVIELHEEFDYFKYLLVNDYEKKKMIIEIMNRGFMRVKHEFVWKDFNYESVIRKIEEQDYKNEWYWKKDLNRKDRKLKASLLLEHDVELMNMFLVVKDKYGSEIIKKHIINSSPSEWDYSEYLGQLKWISDTKIGLRYNDRVYRDNPEEEWAAVFDISDAIRQHEKQ